EGGAARAAGGQRGARAWLGRARGRGAHDRGGAGGGGLGGGGGEAEGGAAGGAGAGGYFAVLGLRQAAHDEQADADSAEAAAVAGLALHEAVEDALEVGGGDADAFVVDGDLDPRAVHARPDVHGAAVRRVFDRVLQQLADDDVGRHRVAVRRGQVRGDVRDHRVLVGQRLERVRRAAQHAREVERPVAYGQLVRPGPRAEQQLLDQPAERAGPLGDRPHRGTPVLVGQLIPAAGQRAGEALHDGDRGTQLVAGRGQEQVFGLLELLGRGDVAEVDDELALISECGAQDVEPPAVRQLV